MVGQHIVGASLVAERALDYAVVGQDRFGKLGAAEWVVEDLIGKLMVGKLGAAGISANRLLFQVGSEEERRDERRQTGIAMAVKLALTYEKHLPLRGGETWKHRARLSDA